MLTNRVKAVSKRAKSVIRIGAFICVSLVAVGLGPRFAGLSPSGNAYALPGTLPAKTPGGPAKCGSQYEPFTPWFSGKICKPWAATCGLVPFGRSCWVCDAKAPQQPMKEAPNSPTAKYYEQTKHPCPGTYTGECVKTGSTWFGKNYGCVRDPLAISAKNDCGDYEVTRPAAKCTSSPGGG